MKQTNSPAPNREGVQVEQVSTQHTVGSQQSINEWQPVLRYFLRTATYQYSSAYPWLNIGPVWHYQACQTLVVTKGHCASHDKATSTTTQNDTLYLADLGQVTSNYYELLTTGQNITADLYWQELKRVQQVLKQKQTSLVNRKDVLFPYDNTRPHGARVGQGGYTATWRGNTVTSTLRSGLDLREQVTISCIPWTNDLDLR